MPPIYFYECETCKNVREDECNMRTFKEHEPPCTECGATCKYTFIPTLPQVAFKDGPSGSWPSKGERIKKQRQKSSEAAEKRQNERFGKEPNKLIPNFEGKEVENWREAQDCALKERGKESSNTYQSRVDSESKKIST